MPALFPAVAVALALASQPAAATVDSTSTGGGPRSYAGPQSIPAGPTSGVEPWVPGPSGAAIERVPDATAADPPSQVPGGPPAADSYDPTRDSPEGVEASKRVRGGVFLAVAGAVLVAGAAALSATDPCLREAGNGCQEAARTRAALSMGIPGGVMLGAAAVLIGIGVRARRRLRPAVELGRAGGAFVVRGRF